MREFKGSVTTDELAEVAGWLSTNSTNAEQVVAGVDIVVEAVNGYCMRNDLYIFDIAEYQAYAAG
jgi:hypothetical protein